MSESDDQKNQSADQKDHFRRFQQKYVTITKNDGGVLNCYLIQAGGLVLSYLPGGIMEADPQQLLSTDVESMTEWDKT